MKEHIFERFARERGIITVEEMRSERIYYTGILIYN